MKTYIIVVTILVIMLMLPAALHAQATDPGAVVTARVEAMNAGDVDAAVEFFAENAVYRLSPAPPGTPDTFNGRNEIRGRLADLVAANGNTGIEITQVDGENITALSKYSDDGLRGMGVDFIEGVEEYIVQNGKITSYQWTMTEESLAKMTAAMPPEVLPESGGATSLIYAVILTFGGLAIVGGIGLVLRRHAC